MRDGLGKVIVDTRKVPLLGGLHQKECHGIIHVMGVYMLLTSL